MKSVSARYKDVGFNRVYNGLCKWHNAGICHRLHMDIIGFSAANLVLKVGALCMEFKV